MESRRIKNIIKEETQPINREEMVDHFLSFCQDKLGYSTPAQVELVDDRDQLKTLASYNLQDNSVKVYSKNIMFIIVVVIAVFMPLFTGQTLFCELGEDSRFGNWVTATRVSPI